MLDKFYALEKREQHAVIFCAVAVVLFTVYQFIWSPFSDSLDKLKKQVSYQQNLLVFMKQAEQSFQPGKSKVVTTNAKLLSLTSTSLKQAIKNHSFQLNQSADGSILLAYNAVPYTNLMQWMQHFWSRYQLNLVSIDLTPLDTPGLVKAQVSFKAAS